MAAGSAATIWRTEPLESCTSARAAICRPPITSSSKAARVPEPSSRVITVIGADTPPSSCQLRRSPA